MYSYRTTRPQPVFSVPFQPFLEGRLIRSNFSGLLAWVTLFALLPQYCLAEKLELQESYTDDQTYNCEASVTSKGDVFVTKTSEKKENYPLASVAKFQFAERRLPPAGRDALAFRAVRKFQSADMVTSVGDHKTEVKLPNQARVIVSEGYREGIRHYCPSLKLDRDSIDLLELPGDPLVLAALLPLQAVDLDEEWIPSDWVMQMLTGIEAVESSELTCKLTAANSVSAKISFNGKVKGQRFGANTEVDVKGTLIFDLRTNHVARTQAIYTIKADVGTVYPGLEIVVSSNLVRNIAQNDESFTADLLNSIPLEPEENSLELQYAVPQWGVTLNHGRNWHLYQAVFDTPDPVAILRLVEHGSLVCQCNFSPQLKAAPGQDVPIDQFEADIQRSLGDNFKKVLETEEIPTNDGRSIYRVSVEGEQEYKGVKGGVLIPMNWIYYLVSDQTGNQISFVFAVEKPLVEQLNRRDVDIVKSLRFVSRR